MNSSMLVRCLILISCFYSGYSRRNNFHKPRNQFDVGQNHEDFDSIFQQNQKPFSENAGQSHMNFDFDKNRPNNYNKEEAVGQNHEDFDNLFKQHPIPEHGQSHMNFDFNDKPSDSHVGQVHQDFFPVGQENEDIGQKNDFSLHEGQTLEDPFLSGQKYEDINFGSNPKKDNKMPERGDLGQIADNGDNMVPGKPHLINDFEEIHFGKKKIVTTEIPFRFPASDQDFGQQHMEDIFPMQDDQQSLNFPDFPGGSVQQKPISAGSAFKGGCNSRPPTPMNAVLKCSLYSGCKATCQRGHEFPGGEMTLFITCKGGEWKIGGDMWQVVPPCRPICLPACQNNGICIAPNQCQCQKNYGGPQCQFEKKPCLNHLPLPANSMRSCSSTSCTVTCAKGFTFPGGSSITNLICKDGQWRLSRSDWVSLPDCKPICDPPCINGGSCLSLNICQCPQQFTGPQCQYEMNACSGDKLHFNGIHNCSGNGERLVCELRCPPGIQPSIAIAKEYTCFYSTAQFTPQPIPSCVYGDDVMVIPLNSSSNTYYSASQVERGTYHSKTPGKGTKQSKQVSWDIIDLFEGNHKPSPGECFMWGKTHLKNFDGGLYSFNSLCPLVLSKDSVDGSFEIIIKNKNCTGTYCQRSFDILYQNSNYSLTSQDSSPQLLVDGKVTTMPTQLVGFTAEMTPALTMIRLHSLDLLIKWNNKDFISVSLNENMWNRTVGLCGNLNKMSGDDFYTKSGTAARSLESFLESWSVGEGDVSCSDPPSVVRPCQETNQTSNQCNLLLNDPHFASCREVVNVKPFYDACLWDTCDCSSSCACATIESFIRQCQLSLDDPSPNWRAVSNCPFLCPSTKLYSSCGRSFQARCGDTQVELEPEPRSKDLCVEGCYCPPFTVLDGDDCVPVEMCSCQLRGKSFPSGSTVPKGCNTCTCNNGRWTCTEARCGARCSSIGDPHYVTFDGRRFDFMGQCSYYLVKTDNFSIEAENVPCSGSISKSLNMIPGPEMPTCTKAVNIKLKDRVVRLKQSSQVFINNEQVDVFPHQDDAFAIRQVSSLYLMVSLDNGVDIWWDGVTSVYVDVPANMHGQTAGLCGKFNLNQKDDFLTPEGDIEQAVVPFGNKWKTQESCREVVDKTLDHPCERDPTRREKALHLCSKLKSSTFKPCHWHVDVEIYYQNCLFDLCSCATDLKSCFCPVLADYAGECAREGVPIVWRSEVRECGLHCSGGQTYQACGDTCTRSCQDISMFPSCRRRCVEGCNCPTGQTLDSSGVCIPISQCPCLHHNREYNSGMQLVISHYKGPQFCTCTNALWDCRPATTEEATQHSEIEEIKSKCSATRNEQFTHCEPAEPITCKNMHNPPNHTPAKCMPGCTCKAGYVWDSIGKQCVKSTECPCHHGGVSYENGSSIQEDCNTCVCNGGKWKCTERACPAVCSAWGDSHLKTFDGKIFDFQGSCDFLLSGGALSDHDIFDVIIQIVPCGTSGVSCPKSLTLKVGRSDNMEELILTKGRPLPPMRLFKRISVREVGMFVFVEVFDLGLVLQWDKSTQIYIKADPKWRNKVKGLCGNMNNDELDDLKTPSGGISEVSPVVFADSWKLHPYCPESTEIKNPCEHNPHRRNWAIAKCGVLKSSIFKACHSEVPLDAFIERCILDTCGCDEGGDCECLCSAIAAYSHACSQSGVPIKWRSQELCPIQCDHPGSKYTSCISACPVKTCDNVLIHNSLTRSCGEESCVEGCDRQPCEEGMIFSNGSYSECIEPSKCKTTCLTVGSITYFEGDLMESDDCHSCYCSHNKKVCSGVPCTTESLILTTPTPAAPNDAPICISGWSSWINRDHPIPEKKKTDYEPLPSFDSLVSFGSPAHCNESQIADIRCRDSWDLTHYKETGFDVECGLIDGLKCESSTTPCPDFEISVLCECRDAVTTSTTVSTTTSTTLKTTTTTQATTIKPTCPLGEKWVECAIACNQTCHFFGHYLINRGLCSTSNSCLPGCQPENWEPCENEKWLRDALTCVNKKDCTCRSDSGDMVKPGSIFHESECGKCQCINNQYECDFADCFAKPTKPPSTTPSTRQDRNLFNVTLPQVVRKDFGNVTLIYLTTPSTITPPPKCIENKYHSLLRNKENVLWSSSSDRDFSTTAIEGQFENTQKSWIAERENMDQYLQVDIGKVDIVYGVVVAGDVSGHFVTSFRLLHSLDGATYRYISTPDNINEVFRGPIDGKTPVKQILNEPIEARYIRFNPFSWHGAIAMRVDILGCGGELEVTTELAHIVTSAAPVCEESMGLDSGLLPVNLVTGSSAKPGHGFEQVRLSSESAWKPMTSSQLEFLMIDLLAPRNLTGIVTLGMPHGNDIDSLMPESWIESYRLIYSPDGVDWNPILDTYGKEKVFLGNFDGDSPRKNWFDLPIKARFIKFIPLTWRHEISVRLELLGCYEPYPEITTTTTTHAPTSPLPCQMCPGVEIIESCPCKDELWWNGEECLRRAECPCMVGHIAYGVGSVFYKENCEECTCRLNGISSCSPKECDLPCPHNQRNTLTPSCACVCKPCETGSQLCPTSGVCISQVSWCDGVQDCPDDESNCVVPYQETTTICNTTCPPGYGIIYTSEPQEVEIFEPSRFMAAKKSTKSKSVKSAKGVKNVKKPIKYKNKHACPPYECVPVPTIPPTECPQPSCPRNFTVEKKEIDTELAACPRFICRPPKERAVCSFSGRIFKTFDDVEYKYDVCDHILATDIHSGDWNVSIFKTCRTTVPCSIGFVINHSGTNLIITEGNNIQIDGFQYSTDQVNIINSRTKEFNISRIGESWVFISHTQGFNVSLDDRGTANIEVDEDLKGTVNGLCGLYNGDGKDDKTSPDGKILHLTNEFGNSWITPGGVQCDTQVCPIELQEKALALCFEVKKQPFSICSDIVNVNKFISLCLESTCACLQSNKTVDECRCASLLNFVTSCKTADTTKDLTGWRLTHDCGVSCPAGMTFHDCYPYACEATCQEQSCFAPATSCYSGCFCADGYVRSQETCVKPTECYDCVCEGTGDSMYLDFNGRNISFNGNCSYAAARLLTPSGGYDLQVIVTNRPCEDREHLQCTNEISIFLRGHTIILKNAGQGMTAVDIDGLDVKELPYNASWVLIESINGAGVYVFLPYYSTRVAFHYPKFTVSLPSSKYDSTTEGLCGNCLRDKTKKEIETTDLGQLWLVKSLSQHCEARQPECHETKEIPEVCNVIMDSIFAKCHSLVDPLIYIGLCKQSMCYNGSFCHSVEAYSKACREVEVCIDWRNKTLCPMECSKDLVYRPCALGCTLKCENFQEMKIKPELCPFKNVEGCFCPDNQVSVNGTCVDALWCETCDVEGHHSGDSWVVDKCTNCTCERRTVKCKHEECAAKETLCSEGFSPIQEESVQNQCCPKFICVPNPTQPTVQCPDVIKPECGYGQILKLETDYAGCPRYICRCKLPEECEELPQMDEQILPLGMERHINTTGCCPRAEIICNEAFCSLPPDCPQHYKTITIPATECCQTYRCDKPTDICFYGMENPSTSGSIVKMAGTEWNDGPCKTCVCEMKGGQAEVVCSKKECAIMEIHPDFADYDLQAYATDGVCCPNIIRVGCKVNGIVYKVGSSWFSDSYNKCISAHCVKNGAGEIIKEIRTESCKTECDLGWSYNSSSKSCCGECTQTSCILGDKLYKPGQSWQSFDNCTTYFCRFVLGGFLVTSESEKCPDISDCPLENRYQDGCCSKCKLEAPALSNCAPTEIPSLETIKLVQEYQTYHGKCTNMAPIPGFTECTGACDSHTIYNKATWDHDSVCQCCQAIGYSKIKVPLTCNDGYVIEKTISVPSKCLCQSCGSS